MKKTGAQIITKLLEMHGIETAAGIPGGSILPLYDELTRSSIHHVLVRQEQAGGFIAQGMARTNGLPAVCLATSGPGAMNLLTAIADARCDSVPIIAITGQVNTYLIGTDAFQEADTFGLSFPITKHSVMVKSPEELLTVIPEAFKIAMNGRPGPVLIDVPRDVQTKTCEFDAWPKIKLPLKDDESTVRFHTKDSAMTVLLEKAAELLAKAKKPVLFAGGGCNSPEAAQALRAFTKSYRIPAVSSLMGLGAIPSSAADFAGMIGMHGTYAANKAMYESDLVLACGVRFDDRATGVVSKFCPNAKIIHIDIDAAEINKILDSTVSIVAKVETAVPELTKMLKSQKADAKNEQMRAGWADEIISVNKNTRSTDCGSPSKEEKNKSFTGSANPRTFIASIPALAEKAGLKRENLLVTTDVGQHQMWAAQYYPVEEPRTFLTSGSLGTMGFGLPAAIGAAIANPKKRVICFSGDGSIMMNIQELATLAENNLPVTVIVFENGTLGMVYQQQKYLFDKTYSASEFAASPDLLKIAEGFGIETADADKDADWYKKAFDEKRPNKPFFVRVRVDPEENVLPFVPGGKANIDSIRD
ncbi:MAG: biosynthetic-type acetolactate synthase large subunit [Treponema porcinum]|uniref:biosynthetic-type acetolactate synthase large subunit n=2 Tax=Treponema porcinum TaxID=261392 RepID=UPI0023524D34|nr:biosynthetic-type acetolactate synthase large subunit [Treponema porcinum]MCI6180142.1 biosynthetic-type acetolactate synthase large subunit [Treponema porcinum]MCI6814997.1 biosynthetic-type acetolactate synthase large subunit [Treponema porcinum]MCI7081062.1 biosynthetic-type acetolactate synthase large subunit [Treponema porcinum]MCI7114501.1 biosynthetic-type acetolactate synthase large subunit [Treponema porcinum]MCI7533761.1 biosynthetic-type acetolactate synthase large subunit [Trepo